MITDKQHRAKLARIRYYERHPGLKAEHNRAYRERAKQRRLQQSEEHHMPFFKGKKSKEQISEAKEGRRKSEIRQNANTAREFGYPRLGKLLDNLADDMKGKK